MKRFKLLFSFLKGSVGIYLSAIILCLISVGISLQVPLLIQVVIDSVIGDSPVTQNGIVGFVFKSRSGDLIKDLLKYSFVAVGFVAVSAILEFCYAVLINIVSQKVGKDMKDSMYEHILKLDYEFHSKSEIGDLIQRCTTDIENSVLFLSEHFFNILRVIFLIVITISIMLSLSVKLSLLSIIMVPVILGYSFYFFKKAQQIFEDQEISDGKLTSVIQESLTGVRVIKAFARQEYEIDKFDEANSELKGKNMKIVHFMSRFWSISDGLSLIQVGVVLLVGSYFVLKGYFGIGIVVAFFTYVERIMWPVKQLGRLLAETGKTSISLKRLQEILSKEIEDFNDNEGRPVINGDIEFKNVSFSYPNGKEVLKNINLTIKKGESVAIMGSTGSGKTTLVHLLHRLYEDYTGDILIDGINIKDINKHYLREKVSLILQEPYLFNKTVRDNISYTMDNSRDSEIYKVTDMACIHNSISGFDKGYDTIVGEGGVTLSGGQKQRIAIARTLISNNSIIVFDDSLSAVDTETDKIIRDRLKVEGAKPTSIFISHRVSSVMDADKIVILEDGEVTAMGTHREIMDKDSLYKRILDIQRDLEKKVE